MEFANHCEEILSLKELSARAILSSRNCHHVVQMYDYCNVAGLNSLAAMAKKFMSDKFAFFLERYGEEELRLVLSAEDFKDMYDIYDSRLKIEKRLSITGNVMEREVVKLTETEVKDGYYPLKSLLTGVSWPPDVDPCKREQYLSEEEFEKTFGMTKTEFNTLDDKHKKMRLKKERGLF